MSTMTEKERREAERRKRIRAASREFEKKLGLSVNPYAQKKTFREAWLDELDEAGHVVSSERVYPEEG